jgi:hypothetical protein
MYQVGEAPPGGDADRQQILKEYLMSEFRRADGAGQASVRERHRKRPRTLVVVAGAGVLAIAAAVGLVVSASQPKPAGGGGSSNGAANTTPAAQLLAKVAKAVGSRPGTPVRNGDFEYIRSVVAYEEDTMANGKETVTTEKPHKRRSDASGRHLRYRAAEGGWLQQPGVAVPHPERQGAPLVSEPGVEAQVSQQRSTGLCLVPAHAAK